jgi:hypothetical protein
MLLAHHTTSPNRIEGRTAFREPLHFIVMSVMSVISDAFPDTYRIFSMTGIAGVFVDRHSHRHGRQQENRIDKGVSSQL